MQLRHGTHLGKEFSTSTQHSCYELYALVLVEKPFPKLSTWRIRHCSFSKGTFDSERADAFLKQIEQNYFQKLDILKLACKSDLLRLVHVLCYHILGRHFATMSRIGKSHMKTGFSQL